MNKILEKIQKIGIVPVVVLDDAKDAVPLAKALIDGGLPCAEVTFRTEAAEESIRNISAEFPDMLVGAGTVLTVENVKIAVEAGAKFIVSPGLNPKVVKYCIEHNIPITPGVSNPSDIEAALELGLEVLKFFPAEAAGGLNMIKAMAAPYTTVKFMPTGGINAKNIVEYLKFDKIIACGGSWMVNGVLIKEGNFEKITALTREAVMTMLGFEVAHLGMDFQNGKEAEQTVDAFGGLFKSLRSSYPSRNGEIAIRTNSVSRAVNYLESEGIMFDQATEEYSNGTLKRIYMKEEIGGYAIHLIQK